MHLPEWNLYVNFRYTFTWMKFICELQIHINLNKIHMWISDNFNLNKT